MQADIVQTKAGGPVQIQGEDSTQMQADDPRIHAVSQSRPDLGKYGSPHQEDCSQEMLT